MGKFYGLKILNGDMHIGDVPKLWKKMTKDWIDKNGTMSSLS